MLAGQPGLLVSRNEFVPSTCAWFNRVDPGEAPGEPGLRAPRRGLPTGSVPAGGRWRQAPRAGPAPPQGHRAAGRGPGEPPPPSAGQGCPLAAPRGRAGRARGSEKKTLHSAHLSVSPSAIAGRRWALAPGRAFAPPHVHPFANFLVLS